VVGGKEPCMYEREDERSVVERLVKENIQVVDPQLNGMSPQMVDAATATDD